MNPNIIIQMQHNVANRFFEENAANPQAVGESASRPYPRIPMQHGIHLLHKPIGATSFAIVQKFRAQNPQPVGRRELRICHGGALDPFASGLLLILVEPATKLFDYLHDVPKIYDAKIHWGIETDNDDPTGNVVTQKDASHLTAQKIEAAAAEFVGWCEQVPPATSNKRIDGERAYVRVHRGEEVSLPATRVYLHEVQWLAHDLPESSTVRLITRGGYYVRSFARDLGRALGCGAHLAELRRTAIGPYIDPLNDAPRACVGEDLLPWLPRRELNDSELGALRLGKPIPTGEMIAPAWPAPGGFPIAENLIRAFRGRAMHFLLRRESDSLTPITQLGRGI